MLALFGVSVTEQVVEPVPYEVSRDFYADTTEVQTVAPSEGLEWSDVSFESQHQTIPIKGLLTIEGIRFLFTSFVVNFQNFGVIAVTFIAMMGAGLAESAGLMGALIRKLVAVAPRAVDRLSDHSGRRPVERRLGRRLPDPDPARRRRLRQPEAQPDRRPGRRLRRRRRHLRGQRHHPAHRRHAGRDDQRSDRAHRRRAPVRSSATTSSARSR